MSSSFFLKGKSRQVHKNKNVKIKKKKTNFQFESNLENGHESSGSELDIKKFSDGENSESDHETAEQKKVRLAKRYLVEIEKEEASRAEFKELDEAVSKRLQKDYLDQKGKLHVDLADKLIAPNESDVRLIRAREHRLSLTCICISNDGNIAFTGSKCSSIVKWNIKDKRKVSSITHATHSNLLKGTITSLALSTDSKFLAASDESNNIIILDPIMFKYKHTFKGHTNIVTGVVFRKNTHDLYSASKDRTVKVWSLDEMAYVETLFGHQTPITSIDALTRERAVTAGGRDATIRIWKIVEESQLIFNGPVGSMDEVKLLDEEHFVSGSDNGTLSVWSVLKKKPLCSVLEAHGACNGVPLWITSLATILNSDIFASGSHDNNIRVWKISELYKSIVPLVNVKISGFINGMHFNTDSNQLFAVVGQEHKAGRWYKENNAKNGVLIVNYKLKT